MSVRHGFISIKIAKSNFVFYVIEFSKFIESLNRVRFVIER